MVMSSATCAAGALAVGVAAALRQRPLPGLQFLLVPASLVLAVGQVWTIAGAKAQLPPPSGGRRAERGASRRDLRKARAVWFGTLFGDVPRVLARALLTLAFLGWLSGMLAFPALARGGPSGPGGGCRYRLDSHGAYTCVARATYQRAGAGEQRLVSGIILAFFAIHTGAAIGALRRRS